MVCGVFAWRLFRVMVATPLPFRGVDVVCGTPSMMKVTEPVGVPDGMAVTVAV